MHLWKYRCCAKGATIWMFTSTFARAKDTRRQCGRLGVKDEDGPGAGFLRGFADLESGWTAEPVRAHSDSWYWLATTEDPVVEGVAEKNLGSARIARGIVSFAGVERHWTLRSGRVRKTTIRMKTHWQVNRMERRTIYEHVLGDPASPSDSWQQPPSALCSTTNQLLRGIGSYQDLPIKFHSEETPVQTLLSYEQSQSGRTS